MTPDPLPPLRAPEITPPEHGSSSAAPLPGSSAERSGSTDSAGQRIAALIARVADRRSARTAIREVLAERREHGLQARHQTKEKRS